MPQVTSAQLGRSTGAVGKSTGLGSLPPWSGPNLALMCVWLSLGCYFILTLGQLLHLPKPLLPVLENENNNHKRTG